MPPSVDQNPNSESAEANSTLVFTPDSLREAANDVAIDDPLLEAAEGRCAEDSRCGSIPGYSVLGELGRGSMGVVYQAIQEKLQRVVALKVLMTDPSLDPRGAELFQKEAQAVARLSHPNIVTAYDYGESDGHFFLALEYIAGSNCLELIEDEGPLDVRRALSIVRGAILGLSHALDRGLLHRDVKPANLLFPIDGTRDARHLDEARSVKVTDLGLALMEETAAGENEAIIAGTPAYMSPEQARGGELDFRTDIYSLGATLYHMITGVMPHDEGTLREILRAKEEGLLVHPLDVVNSIDAPLAWLVDRMMAKRPDARYQSYEALLGDVEAILDGRVPRIPVIAPEDSSLAPPTQRRVPRLRRSGDRREIAKAKKKATPRWLRFLPWVAIASAFGGGILAGVAF